MRKFALGMLLMAAAGIQGCDAPGQGEASASTAELKADRIASAQQVLDRLKAAKLPIDKVVTITAETDSNQLIGRPHQYTSKIDFIDTRYPEGKLDAATNNIEVFSNDEDATKRRDYIAGIMKEMPLATQYLFLRNNALLRINGALPPGVAKEYETAFTGVKTQ